MYKSNNESFDFDFGFFERCYDFLDIVFIEDFRLRS